MSISSLPSAHCTNAWDFHSQLELFKEAEPSKTTSRVFNRFLVENEEYMGNEPILISTLCKRFLMMRPQFEPPKTTFQDLPSEVHELILQDMEIEGLLCLAQMNKSLQSLCNKVLLSQVPFGKMKWAKLFNVDIGAEPPLPPNIIKTLYARCPIWRGKKICETHMLVLIPKSIDENPLSLKSFGKCLRRYFPDTESGYKRIPPVVFDALEGKRIDTSYWVLMTRDSLPGSRNLCYVNQQFMIAKLSKKARVTYLMPKTLEGIICIVLRCISSTQFMADMRTSLPYTGLDTMRCQEKVKDTSSLEESPVTVGYINEFGISITLPTDERARDYIAISALRKL